MRNLYRGPYSTHSACSRFYVRSKTPIRSKIVLQLMQCLPSSLRWILKFEICLGMKKAFINHQILTLSKIGSKRLGKLLTVGGFVRDPVMMSNAMSIQG